MSIAQLESFAPLVIIVIFFWFFLIRPQQKRQRERTTLLQSLAIGDKVVTIGGIHGTVANLDDKTVTLKVSDAGKMVFERSAVNAIREKAESVAKQF